MVHTLYLHKTHAFKSIFQLSNIYIYKAKKLSVRLSVCQVDISAVSARIDIKFA